MRVILYRRVSTQEQSDSKLGLSAQLDLCERTIAQEYPSADVTLITDDAVSGGIPFAERKNGRRAAEMIAQGNVAAVVALSQDRLFRSMLDTLATLERWEDFGTVAHLVDGGVLDLESDETWSVTIMRAFAAEIERRFAKKRTKRALKQVTDSGRFTGPAPLGFKNAVTRDESGRKQQAGVHAIDSTEIIAARRIIQLAAEAHGPVSIARALNSEGVPTRHGKKWAHGQVQRVLARKERFAEVTNG